MFPSLLSSPVPLLIRPHCLIEVGQVGITTRLPLVRSSPGALVLKRPGRQRAADREAEPAEPASVLAAC